MNSLKYYIEKHKVYRERKNKNELIAKYLIKEHNLNIEVNLLTNIVKEANSLDREWRKILEDNPDLRGNDYMEKDKLMNKKISELGYGLRN